MRGTTALFVIALLYAVPASACRCAQRGLAEYFDEAETVAVGTLVEVEEQGDSRLLHFDLPGPSYKGEPLHPAGTRLTALTSASTASCGVQPELSAIYVIFAYRGDGDGEPLRIDTCSGSRVYLPASGEPPLGFDDVPARYVPQQLNGLAGLEVLRKVAAKAPRANFQENELLIGLLDMAPLAHGGHVDVYSAPDRSLEPLARVTDYAALQSREYSYEQPATIVYTMLPGWYRIRLTDGRFAWASADDVGTFFSYPELAVNRLNYLTDNWSGFVWPEAGAGLPQRDPRIGSDERAEYPVEVHEIALIGGMPFLRITLLEGDVCSGEEPRKGLGGWIPAFGSNGQPTAWFWSRGC